MTVIINPFMALVRRLGLWLAGLVALGRLIGIAASALSGGDGSIGQRITAKLLAPTGQRYALTVLSAFWPNLLLSRKLVTAYDNSGTAIITRRKDVLDVLSRDEDFEVVYEPRMRIITAGENFFLGMQPGWAYTRDVSAMRLAARMTDVEEIILPRAQALVEEVVGSADGRLDLPPDLAARVPADMVARYFGVPGPSEAIMIDWATTLFWYLFADLDADPALDVRAREAAAGLREHVGSVVAARRVAPQDGDDVLNRCLALGAAGTPGMDDRGIRDNLVGLIIGAIPTISKATCYALDELLNRPDALRSAVAAAKAGDDARLANHIWEALRFNPFAPIVYRRATRETIVARSTLREIKIPKGTMVFAVNGAAMHDRLEVSGAHSFRTDRPWDTYIHWGYGLHACFGAVINRAVIPAMIKALLQRPNLRRAAGPAGRPDPSTPFPQHFHVEWDAI